MYLRKDADTDHIDQLTEAEVREAIARYYEDVETVLAEMRQGIAFRTSFASYRYEEDDE